MMANAESVTGPNGTAYRAKQVVFSPEGSVATLVTLYGVAHNSLIHSNVRIPGRLLNWIFVTGDLLTVAEGLPDLFRFLAGLRANGVGWALAFGVLLIAYGTHEQASNVATVAGIAIYLVLVGVLNFTALRRLLISNPLLAWYRRILPAMSQTEQEAIDAGTVWWDGELFSGKPDFSKL